jgi:hypothetical protein
MALTREPKTGELELVRLFLEDYRQKQTSASDARRAAWATFCQTLIASNEFHFVD